MQYTKCDFPGCKFSDKNMGLSRPKGMVNIKVQLDYRAERRFDLCYKHAKELGLDTEGKPTVEDDLLQTLAEFIQDIIKE